jgi:hypothetical protein
MPSFYFKVRRYYTSRFLSCWAVFKIEADDLQSARDLADLRSGAKPYAITKAEYDELSRPTR